MYHIIHIMWYRGEYMGCENLAGMKFAHLLVLKRDEMKKSTHSYWLCQCDCGTICSVAGTHSEDRAHQKLRLLSKKKTGTRLAGSDRQALWTPAGSWPVGETFSSFRGGKRRRVFCRGRQTGSSGRPVVLPM